MLSTLVLGLLLALPVQEVPAARYAEGQVWEYRTRPGDEGSLLKIQRVEPWPGGGQVYHISVIRVRFADHADVELQHLPVSARTLDASVTRLSASSAVFPLADEGIAIWRAESGGVFDIPLAEIVEIADRAQRQQQAAEPPVTAFRERRSRDWSRASG